MARQRRAFVSAASRDRRLVSEVVRSLHMRLPDWHSIVLDANLGPFWRHTCLRELSEVDAVVCVAGPAAACNENVRWELQTARALGKDVFAYAADDKLLPLAASRVVGSLDELASALQESGFGLSGR